MPPKPNTKSNSFQATSASQLREDYERQMGLFRLQPPLTQRFLEAQAQQLADAFIEKLPQTRFTLPDRIIVDLDADSDNKPLNIPTEQREQMVGGLFNRLTGTDLRAAVRHRLAELEGSSKQAVSAAAGLLRYATAYYMVHNMLPSGRSVTYTAAEGEEIPTLPAASVLEPGSAITAVTDAIAEEGAAEDGRGELLVPFTPYARSFYLPQWVALGENDELLVGSVNEAEAHVASMLRFLEILHAAVYLAPYMVADESYQQKRFGMLGQAVNQGRSLARHTTRDIIDTIKRRAAAHDLNRGLSLSLPYFDDQDLQMKQLDFEVIPAGRIMFVPAFVVRSAREEQAKVSQDTRLNASTRKHLLIELSLLEQAFNTPAKAK
jgi:hypothetical protein